MIARRLLAGQPGLVCEPIKLQISSRVRFASLKLGLARLGLKALNLDGAMACRARLPRLAISAAAGERLPRIGERKGQRD